MNTISFQRVIRIGSASLLSVTLAAMLPGCIVQDIHDQIALSNEKLQQIDESFEKVERANAALAKLDVQLERLKTLDTIDTNLDLMNAQIGTLQADLSAVSEHLASLRQTINNIDSTIPFLKFSGDEEAGVSEDEAGGENTDTLDSSPSDQTAEPAVDPNK